MSAEKKEKAQTQGEVLRAKRADRISNSKSAAQTLGIKDYKQMKPKPEAEDVVLIVNPAGIIFEATKSHAIWRLKQKKGFRLATVDEKNSYISLRDEMNKARGAETKAIGEISETGEYDGRTRMAPALHQSPRTDDTGVLLARPYVVDGDKGWGEQVRAGELNELILEDEDVS